jgi:pyrroline-5-carboxylate reductase
MGEALLSRLIQQKVYPAEAVLVSEPKIERQDYLQQQYQIRAIADNRAAASASEVLLLAVKPQALETVIASLQNGDPLKSRPLVISILAGVSLSKLEDAFPEQAVIRAMPNTPATVGAGISAIAPGNKATPAHISLAKSIFTSVGQVVEVAEYLMDAVTGLSGSGPAYVAIAIEALADGGVASGLPRDIALQLAKQTVLGTAQLIQESGLHPAELKDRVTSPGGTTIAGLAELERAGFRSALIEAVRAASRRSQELGK